MEKLEEKDITYDFAKWYFENNESDVLDDNAVDKLYNGYEIEITKKIKEYNENISNIYTLMDDEKQRKVIGSNTYFLLEIKLKGMKGGDELWTSINKLYNELLNKEIFFDISNMINEIKDQTRSFANEYVNK